MNLGFQSVFPSVDETKKVANQYPQQKPGIQSLANSGTVWR